MGNKRLYRPAFQRLKEQVKESQNWRCNICGAGAVPLEVDHKLALYLGGTDAKENLQALCRECHASKTLKERTGIVRKDPDQYRDWGTYLQEMQND